MVMVKGAEVKDRREKVRGATLEEIKSVALEQMAVEGAANLSLRGIASRMGMTAPALYNYYKNRDDLVTALIIDAYYSFGAALNVANQRYPADEYGNRLLAIGLAAREWAIKHRAEYSLIFGTPIPGYHAPEEDSIQAARQALAPLGAIMQEAWKAGQLKLPPEFTDLPPSLVQVYQNWSKVSGFEVHPPVMRLVMTAWGLMQGLISLELYGHLHAFSAVPGDLFRLDMEAFLSRLGLDWSIPQ